MDTDRPKDTLKGLSLTSVAIPLNLREIPRLLTNFWLWDQPDFDPGATDGPQPRLVLCFNNDDAASEEERIRSAFEATETLKRRFSTLDFIYLDLRGERDLYLRENVLPEPKGGYKAGPNNQFFELIERLKDERGAVFQMETDCVPIRSGWLAALSSRVARAEPFWVMGSPYCGEAALPLEFARHINGNAIYAVCDPQFQTFVKSIWRPGLEHFVKTEDPRVAYDIYLEWAFTIALRRHNVEQFRQFQKTYMKFVFTDYVMNISSEADANFFSKTAMPGFIDRHPNTYVLHGAIFAKAVEALRAEGGPPTPARLGVGLSPAPSELPEQPSSVDLGQCIYQPHYSAVRALQEHVDILTKALESAHHNAYVQRRTIDRLLQDMPDSSEDTLSAQK